MTLKLTPEMQEIVDKEIGEGKFSTVEEVVLTALRALSDDEEVEAIGPPEHVRVRSTERMKELLREGLNTPGPKYTDADMIAMRKELVERGRISKR